MTTSIVPDAKQSSGFRRLKVVDKVRESTTITSFHLEPVEPEDWQDYRPGQFLVFRMPGASDAAFELRNYSVSHFGKRGRYRISVKREPAAAPGLPAGLVSNHLHDGVEIGDELLAAGPRGTFVLDETSEQPVVLISGGVGLTPLVAMFQQLATTSERTAWFIHACDDGAVHALAGEVAALAQSRPGLRVHTCYRFPTSADRAAGRFDSEGVVNRELLQSLLPLDDYDFYLCGPPPFMKAVYPLLRSLGVPKARIAYEFFGPATVLDETSAPEKPAATAPAAATGIASDEPVVSFRRSGVQAAWDAAAYSLLDFAEAQGLCPDFSCRAGICSTCKSALLSGEVEYFEEPLEELEQGEVLLCCSRPRGPVVIDI